MSLDADSSDSQGQLPTQCLLWTYQSHRLLQRANEGQSSALGVPYPAQNGGCAFCFSRAAGQVHLASGASCSLGLMPASYNTQSTLQSFTSCNLLGLVNHLSYKAPLQCQTQSMTQVNVDAEIKSTEKARGQQFVLEMSETAGLQRQVSGARDLASTYSNLGPPSDALPYFNAASVLDLLMLISPSSL